MKPLILLTIILASLSLKSYSKKDTIRSTIKFHINTRSTKIDTVSFDYYFSVKCETRIKSVLIELTASYERDNGINYFAHNQKLSFKYGQIGNIYSQEKNMKLLYATIYYPIKEILKVGYDFSINDQYNHSLYMGLKYKFIDIEIAFFQKLHRIKYSIEPVIKKWKKVKLTVQIKGLYLNNRFKWQNGLALNYDLN